MTARVSDPQDESGYLSLAARAANHGMVLTDVSGRITWVNASFERLCGYSLKELLGRRPSEVLHGPETDASAVARMREALAQGLSCKEHLVNYRKDGKSYRVLIESVPVHDELEQLVRYFSITWPFDPEAVMQRESVLGVSDRTPVSRSGRQNRSLLPLCAWCKHVRSTDGGWHSLEDYLMSALHQPTTSTICPTCAEKIE